MTVRSPWTCILWDVDGTVVDASDGILRRLTIALEHFGKPAPTREELVHWIGPPMFESFQKNVGMTPEESSEAVSYYRAIGKADGYTTGAKLYPGIADLMAELASAGLSQATASSKPENQVAALVEYFDLSPYLRAAGADTSRPVLIGDRHHDVDGGAAQGVPVIFVRWGFSWPHESEGAAAVVDDVDELRALLLIEE